MNLSPVSVLVDDESVRLSVIGRGYRGGVCAVATASIDRDAVGADVDELKLVTEWDEYRRELDPEHASSLARGRVAVDGLDAAAWRAAGWTYYGMGRP